MGAASDTVKVLWFGDELPGLSDARRLGLWSGLALEFHACELDDACISRIAQSQARAVVLAGPGLLREVKALRAAAPGVAIIVISTQGRPTVSEALLEGAHEHATAGELVHFPVVLERALARAQAERRLTEHRDRLRALFDAMSSGVIVTRSDGRVVDVNQPAIRYLNLRDPSDLIDQTVEALLPGLGRAINETPTGMQRQVELELAGGEHRTLGFSSTASVTGTYRFTLFRDLTPMIDAQRRRRRAEQLAQVGEMAARLSHEIKNPLASVLAGLELLFDDAGLSVDQRSVVRDMTREARILSRTIQELLSCARDSDIEAKCLALVDLAEDAVRSCRTFAERKGVELAFESDVHPSLTAVVDALWFRRALINLLINGIEATGRGGKVVLTVGMLAEEKKRQLVDGFPHEVACVQVRDDGPGIDCEEARRVFDPFFTTKDSGTGLGLSVATDVVEALGGVLTLLSMPGRGCVFRAYVPSGDMARCWEACPGRDPDACARCVVKTRGTGYACWSTRTLSGQESLACRRSDCVGCDVYRNSNLRYYWSSPVVTCTEE